MILYTILESGLNRLKRSHFKITSYSEVYMKLVIYELHLKLFDIFITSMMRIKLNIGLTNAY